MSPFAKKFTFRLAWIVMLALVSFVVLVFIGQRGLLFYPTHDDSEMAAKRIGLTRWVIDHEYTGYARLVDPPRKVWLFIHGNGGQAANRSYVFGHLSRHDAVYILEYPGYGDREGSPSKEPFDAAALKAYQWLVTKYGIEKIALLGESLGSGPTSLLAKAPIPPRQIVLMVPFDTLVKVANDHYPFLMANLLMRDRWDNIAALRDYHGRLDIFGGTYDRVIPVDHARALAAALPGSVFHEFSGGHDWGDSREIDLTGF